VAHGAHITGLVGAVALIACASANYQPTLPMRARSGDLQLDLQKLHAGASREFVFQSRSPTPHTIRQGWLTEALRAPCKGGEEMIGAMVDGAAGTALTSGTHELAVKFPGVPSDLALDLVVDLRLDDGGCARAPGLSQSIPMEAANRFTLLLSMPVFGGSDLRGLRTVYGFGVGAGAWFGRFLLTGEVGFGLAVCNESTCDREDKSLASKATFPLALEARYFFAPRFTPTGSGIGLLGLRYGFIPIVLPGRSGEQRFAVHTISAGPGWAFMIFHTGAGPFRHAERTVLMETLIGPGLTIEASGEHQVALSLGLTFRVLLPL
jgi:hypothetical protein